MENDFKIGSRVSIPGGKHGILRFLGETEFAPGEWGGVELDKPEGKNDGSINGKVYFTTQPNYGLFVKKMNLKLDSPIPRINSTISTKESSIEQKSSPIQTGDLRTSIGSVKSGIGKRSPSSSGTSITPPKQQILEKNTNLYGTLSSKATPPKHSHGSAFSKATPLNQHERNTNIQETSSNDVLNEKLSNLESTLQSKIKESEQLQRNIIELQEKIHLLENNPNHNDINELEQKWKLQSQKLQDELENKCNLRIAELEEVISKQGISLSTMETENQSLKTRNAQMGQDEHQMSGVLAQSKAKIAALTRKVEDLEKKFGEYEDTIEILTLDKETLSMDKELAEERSQELEMELESFKTAKSIDGYAPRHNGDDEEIGEQNMKLKAALKALHDRSNKEKNDFTKELRSLEKRVAELSPLEEKLRLLKSDYNNKVVEMNELKEMLDVAHAYEEMVESLTEKNLFLGDRVAELETNLATLEDLKEMSEEMEEQHAEYEKELTREIEMRDRKILDLAAVLASQKTVVEDRDRTIFQFRELVQKNRTQLSNLRMQINQEKLQMINMKDESQAARMENISLRSNLSTARENEVKMMLQELKVEDSNRNLMHLRLYLPEEIISIDEEAIRCRLLVLRVDQKLDFLLRQIVGRVTDGEIEESKDMVELLEEKLYEIQVGKAILWLQEETKFTLCLIDSYVVSDGEYLTNCNNNVNRFQNLEQLLDGTLEFFTAEGVLRKGIASSPSFSDQVCSLKDEWERVSQDQSIQDRTTQAEVKIKTWFSILLLLMNCKEINVLVSVALRYIQEKDFIALAQPFGEMKQEVQKLSLVCNCLEQKSEIELQFSNADYAGDMARGGDTIDLIQSYSGEVAAVSRQLLHLLSNGTVIFEMDSNHSNDLTTLRQQMEDSLLVMKSLHSRAEVVLNNVSSGKLSQELETCGVPSEGKASRWHIRASKVCSNILNASTLQIQLNTALEKNQSLRIELRESEKELKKDAVIREKLEGDLERELKKYKTTTELNERLQAQLVKEREDFDKALEVLHQQKDKVEAGNRALQKALQKPTTDTNRATSSRRSLGSLDIRPGVEVSNVAIEEMEFLKEALQLSRKETSYYRKRLCTRDLDEMIQCDSSASSSSLSSSQDHLEMMGKIFGDVKILSRTIDKLYSNPRLVDVTCTERSPRQQYLAQKAQSGILYRAYSDLKKSAFTEYSKRHHEVRAETTFSEEEFPLPKIVSTLEDKGAYKLRGKIHLRPHLNKETPAVQVMLNSDEFRRVHAIFA